MIAFSSLSLKIMTKLLISIVVYYRQYFSQCTFVGLEEVSLTMQKFMECTWLQILQQLQFALYFANNMHTNLSGTLRVFLSGLCEPFLAICVLPPALFYVLRLQLQSQNRNQSYETLFFTALCHYGKLKHETTYNMNTVLISKIRWKEEIMMHAISFARHTSGLSSAFNYSCTWNSLTWHGDKWHKKKNLHLNWIILQKKGN